MSPAIQVEQHWSRVPGHFSGLAGPLIIGTLLWPERAAWNIPAIGAFLGDALPGTRARFDEVLVNGLTPEAFFEIVREVSTIHRLPAVQGGKVLASAPDGRGRLRLRIAFPAIEPKHTILAARWLANGISALHRESLPPGVVSPEERGPDLLEAARQSVPARFQRSVNDLRIARAATELGRSCRWMLDGYLLVGSGRYGRLFRSTFTETTSTIGSRLARSKSHTAQLLAMAGLPSVRHHRVGSIEMAIERANTLGYPVVLKPNDLDGGVGVYAGLQDESELRQYFEPAFRASRNLLVEKHVDGQDYRLTVDGGRVVKAILRRPGGVTGDGRQSVAALVDAVRAQAPAARRGDSLLSLDEEALAMLARAGMDPDSIPQPGRFVALRMRANMSTGGTSHDAIGDLHPDNARLAVRAADVLRLDVAGIDLLIPDIAVSWLASGAAICEVNAMPQISTEFAPEVFRDLIRRRVPAPGELRAILVLDFGDGSADPDGCVAAIAAALGRQGEKVFWSDAAGLHLDGECVGLPGRDVHASATAAILDREASAAVLAMPASSLIRQGLPWARIDRICVVGTSMSSPDDRSLLAQCVTLSRDHLQGPMVVERRLLPRVRALVSGGVDLATFTLSDGRPTTAWLDAAGAR